MAGNLVTVNVGPQTHGVSVRCTVNVGGRGANVAEPVTVTVQGAPTAQPGSTPRPPHRNGEGSDDGGGGYLAFLAATWRVLVEALALTA